MLNVLGKHIFSTPSSFCFLVIFKRSFSSRSFSSQGVVSGFGLRIVFNKSLKEYKQLQHTHELQHLSCVWSAVIQLIHRKISGSFRTIYILQGLAYRIRTNDISGGCMNMSNKPKGGECLKSFKTSIFKGSGSCTSWRFKRRLIPNFSSASLV